jgi:hypothetical protein
MPRALQFGTDAIPVTVVMSPRFAIELPQQSQHRPAKDLPQKVPITSYGRVMMQVRSPYESNQKLAVQCFDLNYDIQSTIMMQTRKGLFASR